MSSEGTSGAALASEPHLRSRKGCPGTPGLRWSLSQRRDWDMPRARWGQWCARRAPVQEGQQRLSSEACPDAGSPHPAHPRLPSNPDPHILQVGPSIPPCSACSSLPTPLSLLIPFAAPSRGLLQAATEFIVLNFGIKKEEKLKKTKFHQVSFVL